MSKSTKTRALTEEEVFLMIGAFKGKYASRDRALFVLGCNVGFRIGELLSLTIGDVMRDGVLTDKITVWQSKSQRYNTATFYEMAQEYVMAWLQELGEEYIANSSHPLFPSHRNVGRSITRMQAYRIITETARLCGLEGTIATHSMRKSMSYRVYELTSNAWLVSKRLGYKGLGNINSYVKEMSQEEIDDLMCRMWKK